MADLHILFQDIYTCSFISSSLSQFPQLQSMIFSEAGDSQLVKDIIVYDPSSGLILFDIGLAHKQMSLSLFEEPPICSPQGNAGVLMEKKGMEESGFQIERYKKLPISGI
ncbi:hypothetical protein HAX54_030653 [Datura stramonium]|uniref:Uncharacterized protein n=1 Tax=Datura stramonium TaxID=4076 RepID=A0ABS8V809_DATST|nr:hypothetical protein [Datura stramonium]